MWVWVSTAAPRLPELFRKAPILSPCLQISIPKPHSILLATQPDQLQLLYDIFEHYAASHIAAVALDAHQQPAVGDHHLPREFLCLL